MEKEKEMGKEMEAGEKAEEKVGKAALGKGTEKEAGESEHMHQFQL